MHLRTSRGRTACQVENVSMGGIFVRTDRLEEVGEEIVIDLVKPGWKRQLTLNASITSRVDALEGRLSRRMPGMGIQFLRLDGEQHARLQSLLRELGAPEEDLEVTIPDESGEQELRALELDALSAETEQPLNPQPQALWQQVQMAQEEASSPGPRAQAREGARTWEVPKALVDDIGGALPEANLAPPGPKVLEPEGPLEKPFRDRSASGPDHSADNARLMLQIRGLVMQLSEAQQELSRREQEIQRLREELDTLR